MSPRITVCVCTGERIKSDCPTASGYGGSSPFHSAISAGTEPKAPAIEYRESPDFTVYKDKKTPLYNMVIFPCYEGVKFFVNQPTYVI